MKYRTTKQECANMISGVCSQCGGKLSPIETVFNAGNPIFWSGCEKCLRFDNGVDLEIYMTAKELVEKCGYKPHSHLRVERNDSADTRKHKNESQISGACSTVMDILRIHAQIIAKG